MYILQIMYSNTGSGLLGMTDEEEKGCEGSVAFFFL